MGASSNGHREIVRTLLENDAAVGARDNVRNQLMIRMKIIVNIDDGGSKY
jgi:hypothetical protein